MNTLNHNRGQLYTGSNALERRRSGADSTPTVHVTTSSVSARWHMPFCMGRASLSGLPEESHGSKCGYDDRVWHGFAVKDGCDEHVLQDAFGARVV